MIQAEFLLFDNVPKDTVCFTKDGCMAVIQIIVGRFTADLTESACAWIGDLGWESHLFRGCHVGISRVKVLIVTLLDQYNWLIIIENNVLTVT